VALAGFVTAATLSAGGVSAVVFGLVSGTPAHGGATVIPVSVTTAVPRLSRVHGIQVLARSVPVRIRIPAIGVSAPVMKLGKNPDGTVQVPPLADHNMTGWYQYGPAPGQLGPAVILGHVDSLTGISVFYYLKDLRRGDQIYITLADGKVTAFAVDGLQKAAKDAFPAAAVYAKGGYPGLRLITCGGPFDQATGHYLDNIIIYAHMTAPQATTLSGTQSRSPSPTVTVTVTVTPTVMVTPTVTMMPTVTVTPTVTVAPTVTVTPTPTVTVTPMVTVTPTVTVTPAESPAAVATRR
jgi:sortase (surface protein transpeptidase)